MEQITPKQLNGEGSFIDKKKIKKIDGFNIAKLSTPLMNNGSYIVQAYNSQQIAINKFKEGLNLLSIDYNLFKYKESAKTYMISEYRNHMTLETKLKKYNADIDFFSELSIQEIRKIFAFQWLLQVPNISEKTVMLKHYLPGPESYYVVPLSYNETYGTCRYTFPDKVLKKWFEGDIKNLYKATIQIFPCWNIEEICNRFESTLIKHSPQDVGWKEILQYQLEVLDTELQNLSADKQYS